MENKWVALVAAGLAGIPVGSIYAWSVYIDPINTAKKGQSGWHDAGAHATSVVIAALAVSCAISGRIAGRAVSIRLLCLWGACLSGLGFALGGLAVGQPDGPVSLFYVGAFVNGFGLAHCYVALIKGTTAWWSHYPGFCSGYIMAITSSGSFVFAWINHLLTDHFNDDEDPTHGPTYALLYTGLAVFLSQAIGGFMLTVPPPVEGRLTANTPRSPPPPLLSTAQIVSSWQFWALVLIWFSNLTPMLGILSVLADVLHDPTRFDQSTGTSATLLALVNATGVGFRLIVGMLVARVGTKRFFAVALASQIVMFALMPSVAIHDNSLGIFMLLLCLGKICYGAGFTLINLLSAVVFGKENGTQVFSLCISAFAFSAIFSPSIIHAVSLSTYCYLSAGIAAVGLVVLVGVRPYELSGLELGNKMLLDEEDPQEEFAHGEQ